MLSVRAAASAVPRRRQAGADARGREPRRARPRRKPLQFEDIWELPEGDKVENITAKFEKSWEQEMQKPVPSLVRTPRAPPRARPAVKQAATGGAVPSPAKLSRRLAAVRCPDGCTRPSASRACALFSGALSSRAEGGAGRVTRRGRRADARALEHHQGALPGRLPVQAGLRRLAGARPRPPPGVCLLLGVGWQVSGPDSRCSVSRVRRCLGPQPGLQAPWCHAVCSLVPHVLTRGQAGCSRPDQRLCSGRLLLSRPAPRARR